MPRPRLSKSKYVVGLQCLRRLWWAVHEPDAPELVPDPALRAVFEQGRRVGEVAREHVPGGVLIHFDRERMDAVAPETRAAIEAGAPAIYEACFSEHGVFVAVDILEREGEVWNLVEVKSTTRAKEAHVPDAAVQAFVVEAAGLRVGRVEVMHLNRACRFPDLSDLFVRTDVTARVRSALPGIAAEVEAQRDCLAGPLPEVEVGRRCSTPYDCPFRARCWPESPADPIGELYRSSRLERAELADLGCETIGEIPSEVPLSEVADRQRRAVRTGEVVVEEGLGEALRALEPPLAYLDFETINPAIPVWRGCGPYQNTVVQLSVHLEDARGGVEHREWLAQSGRDPREESVERLLEATSDVQRVAVYHAPFEGGRIRELAERFPRHAGRLGALEAKLVDVLPIVRDHVYHPAFHGSFSLKSVVPALAPGASYEALTIADGDTARRVLQQLLLEPESMTEAERAQARVDLLAYCKQDTWALVEVTRVLREMGGAET